MSNTTDPRDRIALILDISYRQFLGTEEIFIIKHEGCGMLTGTTAEMMQGLKSKAADKQQDFSHQGYQAVKHINFFGIKDKGVEQALADDVAFLQNHPAIKKKIAIHGFIYSVTDGRTRQLFSSGLPMEPERQHETERSDEEKFVLEIAYEENGNDPEYEAHLYERVVGPQDAAREGNGNDPENKPKASITLGERDILCFPPKSKNDYQHPETVLCYAPKKPKDDIQPPGAVLGKGGSKAGSAPSSPVIIKRKVGPKGPKKAAADAVNMKKKRGTRKKATSEVKEETPAKKTTAKMPKRAKSEVEQEQPAKTVARTPKRGKAKK